MSTVTKAANAHTTVVTGWTTPQNAYSTTNDSTYATLVCPKNSTNSGDFGFPAFTTAEIPDHSTISSVVFYTTYGLTATATGALVGEQARRNSTGATLGSEITRALASMADANGTATGATLTDLRTANELRVRARASKGNSSTASTAQIDRLYIVVTFTETVSAAAGALTLTPTMSLAAKKATSKALGSLASTGTFSEVGTKATSAVAGSLPLTPTMLLSGVAQSIETHSGSGALTLSEILAAAGLKSIPGAGSLTLAPLFEARAGGVGALVLVASLDASGAMGALGTGALTGTETMTAAAAKDTGDAAGTVALEPVLALEGVAYSSVREGAGSLTAAVTLALEGSKATSGEGALALLPSMTAASTPTAVPIAMGSRRRLFTVAPAQPVRRAGRGTLVMFPRMWAGGTKTSETDDELVLALIA